MAQQIKVRYDPEEDFIEVLFSDKAGYMKETNNDAAHTQGKGTRTEAHR